MKNFEIYGCELIDANNIFPFKNINFIVDFVRFNRGKENEHIFINPIFKILLKFLKDKIKKKIKLLKPIGPLVLKLLRSLEKWN